MTRKIASDPGSLLGAITTKFRPDASSAPYCADEKVAARKEGAAPEAGSSVPCPLKGGAQIGFLFHSADVPGKKGEWHRWWSKDTLQSTGWHHIAVAYRFGDPASIRGWIDGQPLPGAWDMGGPTAAAPVVDDDAVWIGSSMKGAASASFRGSLDSVAIHREILSDAELKARFRRKGGPVVGKAAPARMPEVGALPAGLVQMTFHEGMPAHDRWLNEGENLPRETTRWAAADFLLPRLPVRYEEWGIRAGWKPPVLARLAADVALPSGQHRVILRARGLTRLWVDGTLVATTKAHRGNSGGHEPMTPLATPPHPGLRPAPFGLQEVFGEITVAPAAKRAQSVHDLCAPVRANCVAAARERRV